MPSYDIFFFGALFFLIGVLLASFGVGFWILILVTAASAAFFFWGFWRKNKKFLWLGGLVFFVIFGALYYTWDDLRFRENINIAFDEKSSFFGVIVSNPTLKISSQEFKLKLASPLRGNVLVKTSRYPEFSYGDEVKIGGKIEKPFSPQRGPFGGSYAAYLAKERISGVISFAEVQRISSGNGNKIKSRLFNVKNQIITSFKKVLGAKESAFLSGLTLGERGEFPEEFKAAMSKSGTTHLVALSGYNITIIVWAVMGIFVYFLSRRLSFILTIFVIFGFVMMTGAEASVVRAAIMGILVILAREVGRFFDFRNAIVLAGFVMVFQNPKVLVFDVGFQLSFLALLGIIYLRPALVKFFRITKEPGFLSSRDNLLTTASAQLMVAPLLISNFGNFSLTSLFANIIVLEFIPVTMGLGFIIAAFSWFSYNLAFVFSWLVEILLKFEILIIEFFAKISVSFAPSLGLLGFVLYYIALIVFIGYVQKRFRQG